ncbi:uncharacterized protein LOC132739964 [Ruditapes philippinarum]|uniref:uncharacterized protein LOC132739964 n=1 Tax=Ruditapes philippinarum TaxID=129788 RepID=UPI00295B6153|nr:uncharacterized protein LOC132739964 [Ruditapes philippinarum]
MTVDIKVIAYCTVFGCALILVLYKLLRVKMGFLRILGICAVLCVFEVTGIDFTISREKILLGSSGTLTMRCDVTETDIKNIYLIQIRRLKSTTLSGSDPNDWQTLALMEIGTNESPTLTDDITAVAGTKDYVAGGSWDSTTPANTYLSLSINIEKLVCDDARVYRCELIYKSIIIETIIDAKENATFSAYAKPQVTSLVARKNGSIVQGMSPSDMATSEVGDELELTCTANIGSFPGTVIRWNRTSDSASDDEFIIYQPPLGTFDDGFAVSDNQCGYTRVALLKYNISVADANMDNNLAFECYVTVSGDPYGNSTTTENNPKFYTDVYDFITLTSSTIELSTYQPLNTTGMMNGATAVEVLYPLALVVCLFACGIS